MSIFIMIIFDVDVRSYLISSLWLCIRIFQYCTIACVRCYCTMPSKQSRRMSRLRAPTSHFSGKWGRQQNRRASVAFVFSFDAHLSHLFTPTTTVCGLPDIHGHQPPNHNPLLPWPSPLLRSKTTFTGVHHKYPRIRLFARRLLVRRRNSRNGHWLTPGHR